jgi:hypothetical protein
MYRVIIECEMSEKDYANRHEIAKEISGGKIDKFDILLSRSLQGLYNTLKFRFRKCVISNDVNKWINPL